MLHDKKQTGMRWVKLDTSKKKKRKKKEIKSEKVLHFNSADSFWVLRNEFSLTINKLLSEDLRHHSCSNVGISFTPCYLLSYFLNRHKYNKAIRSQMGQLNPDTQNKKKQNKTAAGTGLEIILSLQSERSKK